MLTYERALERASVSIRQHTSAYVSKRQQTSGGEANGVANTCLARASRGSKCVATLRHVTDLTRVRRHAEVLQAVAQVQVYLPPACT